MEECKIQLRLTINDKRSALLLNDRARTILRVVDIVFSGASLYSEPYWIAYLSTNECILSINSVLIQCLKIHDVFVPLCLKLCSI